LKHQTRRTQGCWKWQHVGGARDWTGRKEGWERESKFGDRGAIGYLERGKVGGIDEWDEKGREV